MYLTAFSWVLLKTFRVVQFDQDTLVAYDTRTFQYAVHSSKSLVALLWQKNAVHKFTRKKVLGKWICEVGRQELGENLYALWSPYRECASIILSSIKVCKYFRCSFKTAMSVLDGRIVGGNPAKTEHHLHQVKLLNCCWIELFHRCTEI